jgi:hypothetical protein
VYSEYTSHDNQSRGSRCYLLTKNIIGNIIQSVHVSRGSAINQRHLEDVDGGACN